MGLADLVEIRLQDYRDVDDGPYDAISSIGMFEHVGLERLHAYFKNLHSLLRPEGRLLNHAIGRPARPFDGRSRAGAPPAPRRRTFINRFVFPDGELHEVGTVVSAMQQDGFEVRHLESLREHYGLTLRAWVANLEAVVGRGGGADERGPGPGLAALHGGVGRRVRGRTHPGAPGARRETRPRSQRDAAPVDLLIVSH